MTNKIDREDMLALTRRMNVARSSFTRIAGCYVDKDGDFDGSFNVNIISSRTRRISRAWISISVAWPWAPPNG